MEIWNEASFGGMCLAAAGVYGEEGRNLACCAISQYAAWLTEQVNIGKKPDILQHHSLVEINSMVDFLQKNQDRKIKEEEFITYFQTLRSKV